MKKQRFVANWRWLAIGIFLIVASFIAMTENLNWTIKATLLVLLVGVLIFLTGIFKIAFSMPEKQRTVESPKSEEKTDIKDAQLILEEWKTVIQTQMHFNEMIMRVRTTGVSVVLAVFGAAAFSLQFEKLYLRIGTFAFHAAVPIIGFGLGMLTGVFILDYFYYYKMLLGAVRRGYQIDEAYKHKAVNGTKMFGMTALISKAIGKPGRSKFYVWAFYGIVFVLGCFLLIAVFMGYVPMSNQ
ncbi:MAG: hypothetical protein AOA66_0948 [Candidatus Bathyarchaeota archaeon BA2]|nr:MAG: hypothetical protein AOA66_0948 [Candidatus Bathyarchaeota archaeon BA2]